ncbi:uncharacterized protein LOC142791603 isoform X2 [Rhipicephalus microplus]|uniref:uncharacterized protein LOC142791603 isoform X2 n=1 Tax=Rhipicephalus microplus TaxID=6941 RepID=UPI003F6D7ADB
MQKYQLRPHIRQPLDAFCQFKPANIVGFSVCALRRERLRVRLVRRHVLQVMSCSVSAKKVIWNHKVVAVVVPRVRFPLDCDSASLTNEYFTTTIPRSPACTAPSPRPRQHNVHTYKIMALRIQNEERKKNLRIQSCSVSHPSSTLSKGMARRSAPRTFSRNQAPVRAKI